jgi:FkbM family methyltransferase
MSKYPYKSSHIDYFQIGSHIGNTANDPIYSLEMKNKNIILVEPVPFLYKILKHNYKDRIMMNEIDYLNIAISDYNGYISLFAPSENNDFNKYPFFLNQMASTTDKYIQKFKFNERFPDFKFEKISVPCRHFNDIIVDRGITSIGHLIIDTEGHDYIILMSIDFNLIKPNMITFENCYVDDDNTSKTKYNKLLEHLTGFGYKIIKEDNEDTTVALQ